MFSAQTFAARYRLTTAEAVISVSEWGHRPQHPCLALSTEHPSTTLRPPHSRRVVRGCHPRRTEVLSAKAQPTVTRITPPLTGVGHTICLIRASLLRALSRRSDPTHRHP